jgi:hypothetical protein
LLQAAASDGLCWDSCWLLLATGDDAPLMMPATAATYTSLLALLLLLLLLLLPRGRALNTQ